MAPHTGQSSQLFADANDGNAQFLPKLAGAVVWKVRRKSFKVLTQPTVDNLRNLFLAQTAAMLSFGNRMCVCLVWDSSSENKHAYES